MATKKICDRCGAEINPKESMVKLEVRDYRDQPLTDRIVTELCASCAFNLKVWMNRKCGNATY